VPARPRPGPGRPRRRRPDRQGPTGDRPPEPQWREDRRDGRDGDPGGEEAERGVRAHRPGGRCEQQHDRRRDRALEDHRAGDVAEREGVLSLAHPDHAVELLGKLGRDRRDHEGENRGADAERGGYFPTAPTKAAAPTTMHRAPGPPGRRRPAAAAPGVTVAAVEASQPEWRQRQLVIPDDAGEVRPNVHAVEPEQDDRHAGLAELQPGRKERRGDREAVAQPEPAKIVEQDRAVHGDHDPLVAAVAEAEDRQPRHAHRQRAEHERRPQHRADAHLGRRVATAEDDGDERDRGLGQGSPTAARTEPTAPSARSSLRPNHSIPFVNSSAPARMTTKASRRMTRSTA